MARTLKRRVPFDELSIEEQDAAAIGFWKRVAVAAEKRKHGTFHRSEITDAICSAGRDWHPGMPLGDVS